MLWDNQSKTIHIYYGPINVLWETLESLHSHNSWWYLITLVDKPFVVSCESWYKGVIISLESPLLLLLTCCFHLIFPNSVITSHWSQWRHSDILGTTRLSPCKTEGISLYSTTWWVIHQQSFKHYGQQLPHCTLQCLKDCWYMNNQAGKIRC